MKFTVNLADFAKVLNKVLPAVPRKSTLPVLEHFQFMLSGNNLDVIATDQDIILKATSQVNGAEDGSVLVPAKKLSDIVKALDNIGELEFSVDPSNLEISLKSEAGTYDMKGLDSDEYLRLPELFDTEKPDIDHIKENNDVQIAFIKANDLQRLAGGTLFAVSTDEFRPAMTGVFFQFKGDIAYAVSTDSFRLVRVVASAGEHSFPEDFNVIIPANSAEILKKAEGDVILSSISNFKNLTNLRFDFDDIVFITKIINEKFPPYESVIPKNNNLLLSTSRKELLTKIRRVSIFTSSISHQIKLSLYSDHLIVSGEDEDAGNKGMETLACDFNGEDMTIGFNVKYLEDAITHLDQIEGEDNIYLFISDPTKPILLSATNELSDSIMLVMPTRLIS